MRRVKRLMAFLMSVIMVVSLMVNGQLSGGYRVYAEEEVASDTDATEMTEVQHVMVKKMCRMCFLLRQKCLM